MPRFLKDLTIREVSSVDRGAGEGVRVMLMKRAEDGSDIELSGLGLAAMGALLKAHGPLVAEAWAKADKAREDAIDAYLKRDFTDEQRQAAADAGQAMPDGSFPIKTDEDLKDAVRAIGRAKDPQAARRHIVARAKAMGKPDLLPEAWKVRKAEPSFLDRMLAKAGLADDISKADDAEAIATAFSNGLTALYKAVCETLVDAGEVDKAGALAENFTQYQDYIQGVVPEGVSDAMKAAALIAEGCTTEAGGNINKGDSAMPDKITKADMDKAIADAVKKALEPVQAESAKLAKQLTFESLSDVEKAYLKAKSKKPDPMDDEECAKFAKLSAADRKKQMDDEEAEAKKRAEGDPIVKSLREEVAKLTGQVSALVSASATSDFAKRAEEIGLPKLADVIGKAHKGDPAAVDQLVKALGDATKAINAQDAASALFKEFGKGGTGADAGGTAHDQLMAKAQEYLDGAGAAIKGMTIAKAYTKVYTDPRNKDLVALNKRQEAGKAA